MLAETISPRQSDSIVFTAKFVEPVDRALSAACQILFSVRLLVVGFVVLWRKCLKGRMGMAKYSLAHEKTHRKKTRTPGGLAH